MLNSLVAIACSARSTLAAVAGAFDTQHADKPLPIKRQFVVRQNCGSCRRIPTEVDVLNICRPKVNTRADGVPARHLVRFNAPHPAQIDAPFKPS